MNPDAQAEGAAGNGAEFSQVLDAWLEAADRDAIAMEMAGEHIELEVELLELLKGADGSYTIIGQEVDSILVCDPNTKYFINRGGFESVCLSKHSEENEVLLLNRSLVVSEPVVCAATSVWCKQSPEYCVYLALVQLLCVADAWVFYLAYREVPPRLIFDPGGSMLL